MSVPSLVDAWAYDKGDPAIVLFTEALKAWRFDFPEGARILELGCCESDWAQRLKDLRPDVRITGIDVRPCPNYPDEFIQGDATEITGRFAQQAFPCFDWIVALSSLEHFGLGWSEYNDPVNPFADCQTLENAARALVVGGSIYLDVPYTPWEMFETAHWRCYDDLALSTRLSPVACQERARGFAKNEHEHDFSPVRPLEPYSPFHFVARWLTKVAA